MRRNRVNKVCAHCGITYEVIKARENKTRFCSLSCHGKAGKFSDPEFQKTMNKATGVKNTNWKGGFRKHTEGYRWILIGKKYHLEHRYVMSQHLGRELSRRENVHHKNGNKFDNRLENLELVDVAEHIRQHHREGFYKPMGWSRYYSECLSCGTNQKKHRARGFCTTCVHIFPTKV